MKVCLLHDIFPLFVVRSQAAAFGTIQKRVDALLKSLLLPVEFHAFKHGILLALEQANVHHGGLDAGIVFLGEVTAEKALHQRPLRANHGQEGLDLVVPTRFQFQVSPNLVLVVPVVRTLLDGVGKELVLLRNLRTKAL